MIVQHIRTTRLAEGAQPINIRITFDNFDYYGFIPEQAAGDSKLESYYSQPMTELPTDYDFSYVGSSYHPHWALKGEYTVLGKLYDDNGEQERIWHSSGAKGKMPPYPRK